MRVNIMSKSQVDKLLEAFKRGEHLSASGAFEKYAVATFSQRINDIEARGYNVSRYWHHPRDGQKYMIYFMLPNQFRKVA